MPEHRYSLRGEVDLANASEIETELMALVNATHDDLVIDCDGLAFIDSSGIAVLVNVQRLLELDHRTFRMVNLGDMPRRSIDLLQLGEMLGASELDRA